MVCPRCGAPTHVVASRAKGVLVRRRRACADRSCGRRFTTIELPAGYGAEVSIQLTPEGVVTEVKKR
jgi:transcriptional regulator NrdR family protein